MLFLDEMINKFNEVVMVNKTGKRLKSIVQVLSIPFFTGVFVLIALSFSSNDEADFDKRKRFKDDYSIHALTLPDSMYFADEKVPLDYFDVREALDRELLVNTYWQSHTLLLIKRASRYFPLIDSILEANDVPGDFKYLALIESEFLQAVSPAGAVGFWQFMSGTAKDYGLVINHEIDERYNIEKATEAAAKFLKDAYEKFGSWTMAAAAYNFGRKALAKQIEIQKQNKYHDLLLNTETARYVYRILAVKLILESPGAYGFHVDQESLYHSVPTYEVKVDSSIENFADFAEDHMINYKLLKYFNPWLRQPYLKNPEGRTYCIKIPEKGYRNIKKIRQYTQNTKRKLDID
ncbi:MAG: transglycosylase SLT domain-containing protein [Bacteroidales bacterium]